MSVIRILYVEDDILSFNFVKTFFHKKIHEKVELLHARSGEEAIRMIRREDIHLILLDYFLPGMNGIEVLERIKAEKGGIPVVVITGYGDEKIATEVMKKGAIDYMVKWENVEEIRKAIESYIDVARRLHNTQYMEHIDLGRKRDTMSIIYSLLKNAVGGAKKTRLIYKTNLNSKIIEKYLAYCMRKGYIQARGNKPIYITTDKGMHLLKKIDEVEHLLI
ncbi:MAG: response regulator [Thermoplasmata archaeon]|nr:response regulator [Thermoplasmata archaeon]